MSDPAQDQPGTHLSLLTCLQVSVSVSPPQKGLPSLTLCPASRPLSQPVLLLHHPCHSPVVLSSEVCLAPQDCRLIQGRSWVCLIHR